MVLSLQMFKVKSSGRAHAYPSEICLLPWSNGCGLLELNSPSRGADREGMLHISQPRSCLALTTHDEILTTISEIQAGLGVRLFYIRFSAPAKVGRAVPSGGGKNNPHVHLKTPQSQQTDTPSWPLWYH